MTATRSLRAFLFLPSPMASLRKSWGKMRIVALPLTRAPPPQRIISYYSFKIVPPPAPPPPKDSPSPPSGWLPQEGVVRWATLKVDGTWAGWGKAETGSWRLRVFEFGERFLDRLDFEEGALKRVDVKTAPPTKVSEDLEGAEREEAEAAWEKLEIPLLYPPSVSSAPTALAELRALLQRRIPLHNKGFYTYLLIAPLTAPFMIIPVIPNLPFFFCAWRAWSHYQALRGARHVDALLQSGKIVPVPEAALDAVYATAKVDVPLDSDSPNDKADAGSEGDANQKPRLIVTRDSLGHAMRALDMKDDDAKDVLRAYEQAMNRLR
ncbi:mitochondrial K+-H+ exchange-related-domain-containing protein [Mycena alexandri]|uniref:Mitochondrial K+-H+ exchange-related-domain-containing protein n=1 Tax=Mycena alexandri TaxID=1745969 RepID=A0AAD6WNY7_9AGAR|nr:mitochondrial K+-H+ exchange-related-domain-containing protein [Mycena alexandri]